MTEEQKIKLRALRIIRDSRYGNYVPTEESEREITRIYEETKKRILN